MSDDLRDVFRRALDQIPLRPEETWVPSRRPSARIRTLAWPVLLAVLVVVLAIVGGDRLAAFRAQDAAESGVVAGKAIYLSPSFNGSGWVQIDPETLRDLSTKTLLDIAPSGTNSSDVMVSADGSTILVSDFAFRQVTRRLYDARSGQLRGYLVPQEPMVIDYLSADGSSALGRVNNAAPLSSDSLMIATDDGRITRRFFPIQVPGEIQAAPTSLDLTTRYFITTPAALDLTSTTPQTLPYALYARSWTDELRGPIALPGITAGTMLVGANSTPTTFRPGIALSADRDRIAALSWDGGTLDLVDTKTLAVTSVSIRRRTSLLDLLGPIVAYAKTINDEERRSLAFTPDGRGLITWVTQVHYENGAVHATRAMRRIDVATGLVTAESAMSDGIYDSVLGPDGRSLYLIVRAANAATPTYVLRRLDAGTLEVKAERVLPDYAELKLLVAPARGGGR
jgi:hypothetical protein